MIIDAKDLIAGRLAAFTAKKALLGEKIDIINSEKAVITGNREAIFKKYFRKKKMGVPKKGPFMSKMPDRFLKRIIRGMLPYKKFHGKLAFKRIKCYLSVPEEFKGKATESIKSANVSKTFSLKYVKVGEICEHLGGPKCQK